MLVDLMKREQQLKTSQQIRGQSLGMAETSTGSQARAVPQTKNSICNTWKNKGYCNKGDSCPWLYPEDARFQRLGPKAKAKAKASVESRVSAKVTAALAEAADENMTRFEDLTGKLDQLEKMFEQNSQIVEQRLSRVLAALDAGSSWPPWIEVPASVSSEAPKMARRRRRVSSSREGPATPSQEDTTPGSCNSARMRFSSPTGSDGSEADVGADSSYRV